MSGPPISLDWSYSKESQICIDEHEKAKSMKPRRSSKHLHRMGKLKRIDLLQNQLGYTEDEIKEATKKKKEIQRARSVTNLTSAFWRVEDAAQSASRKIKRGFLGFRNSKSEANLSSLNESSTSFASHGSNSSIEPTLEI